MGKRLVVDEDILKREINRELAVAREKGKREATATRIAPVAREKPQKATRKKKDGIIPPELSKRIDAFVEHEDAVKAAAYTAIAVAIYTEYVQHGIGPKDAAIMTAGLLGTLVATTGSNAQVFPTVLILTSLGFDSIKWLQEVIMTFVTGKVNAVRGIVADMIPGKTLTGASQNDIEAALLFWLEKLTQSGTEQAIQMQRRICSMQSSKKADGSENKVASWCKLKNFTTRD